jgi:hypothetical protein
MKILRGIQIALGAIALLIAGLFIAARFSDGPLGIAPGGALRSGEIVSAPVSDWTPFAAVDTVELQLANESTSRTTWILVHDGRAYIPCSLGFPPFKRWHQRADVDGTAWLRIDGQRYPVSLKRTQDESLNEPLVAIVGQKYGGGPRSDAGVWFFEVSSRPDAG